MALSLEKFVQQLEGSGIVAGDTLKDFLPPKATPQSAEELALELVRKKKLTRFQAEEVSRGKGKSLILNNYVLMEKIGAGGMGQVFKARHQRMDRLVAVKLLPPSMTKDPSAIARFEREVRAAARISHPNIVAAHDADCANGIHFLVMELVEGSDLSGLVKKNGPLSVEKAVNYVLQAAIGLEAAHAEGIVHRDIKPANLLLDKKGTIKILDMGLARLSSDGGDVPQADLTSTGTVMGTVDYMSPEQALDTKSADARADIYALGCSLFYLLTGAPTYQGDTLMKKLLAHREEPIPSLRSVRAEVSEQLESVFKKMVAKKVGDRYQAMSEVIFDLKNGSGVPLNTVALPTSDVEETILVNNNSDLLPTTTLPRPTRKISATSNGSSASDSVESSREANFTDFTGGLPTAPTKSLGTKKLASEVAIKGKRSLLGHQKERLLVGGAVLVAAVIIAGLMINRQTDAGRGTVVVTGTEPGAQIELLNDKDSVEVRRLGDKEPISMAVVPGKYRLKIQKEGFENFTRTIEIKSGTTEPVVAKLMPLQKPDPAPRLVSRSISEICTTRGDFNPSLTKDGLTIVWMSNLDADPDKPNLYISRRKSLETEFDKPRKLFQGYNPVITADGESIFFCDRPSTNLIHEARRIADSDSFDPAPLANGLDLLAYPTGITSDGLTLFIDIHAPPGDETQTIAHVVKRASLAASWEKPVPIKVDLMEGDHQVRLMAASPIPGWDSAIVCVMLAKTTESPLTFLSGANSNGAYTVVERISIPSPGGEYDPALNLKVFNPRYNAITKELVFQSLDLHPESRKDQYDVDIWVVKGFRPASLKTPGR